MDKIQPGSGHIDSSATHRAVQASTILDRRYVKRPPTSNAGKYSSVTRVHSNNVAPSRLINLGVHSTDLEVAQIREAIHEEVDESVAETPDYLTEDAIALNLEVAAATETPDDQDGDQVAEYAAPTEEYVAPEPEAIAASGSNITEPVEMTTEFEAETDPSPVSMYALEAMKRSMMQDLVSGNSSTMTSDASLSETMPTATAPNIDYPSYSAVENQPESLSSADDSYYNTPASPVTEPIDMISKATSDALASIRIATESSDVSDQMASLKAFANSIKADNSPEMAELGNTIEKFANVAMKSTKAKEEAENKVALSVNRSPRIAQSSARLSRPNPTVRHTSSMSNTSLAHPATINRSPKVASINRAPATTSASATTRRPANRRATSTTRKSTTERRAPDNRTLEQALRSVATMDDDKPTTKSEKARTKKMRRKGGLARFALALGCAGACIAAIIYFVGSNIPDISVQVAAMQTGIDAAYPSYIPRGYSLGDISSENGRLTMRFNGPNGSSFTLVEEKSSWDSSALQRNYVEPTWGENFTTTHEQGVTIFLSGSDAAWVNGGILYKITSTSNDLTKKQLRNIVTSI